MIERRVINKRVLIEELNRMTYEYLDELQMNSLFIRLGYNIQIKEEDDE